MCTPNIQAVRGPVRERPDAFFPRSLSLSVFARTCVILLRVACVFFFVGAGGIGGIYGAQRIVDHAIIFRAFGLTVGHFMRGLRFFIHYVPSETRMRATRAALSDCQPLVLHAFPWSPRLQFVYFTEQPYDRV